MEFCRKFSWEDQVHFSKLTGDYNPIHCDVLTSRRLMFGHPVVHGMHAVLWTLDNASDCLYEILKRGDCSIRARFIKPIFLDENITLRVNKKNNNSYELSIHIDDSIATFIKLSPTTTSFTSIGQSPRSYSEKATKIVPTELELINMRDQQGILTLKLSDIEYFSELFPSISDCIGARRVASLALISTCVGMKVPGLNSLFVSLKVFLNSIYSPDASEPVTLKYSVNEVNVKYNMVSLIAGSEGLQGEIDAFSRPSVLQHDEQAISKTMASCSFVNRSFLIIGGSRGLGAYFAKMLANAGAQVAITYSKSKREADEIAQHPSISAYQLDINELNDIAEEQIFDKQIDTLIFCATPKIFFRRTRKLHANYLSEFLDYYVVAFATIFEKFSKQAPKRAFCINPSTVAVEDSSLDLLEYRIAKLALENLSLELRKLYPQIKILTPRLPRLDTDQTRQIGAPIPSDTLDCLKQLVLEIQ